MSQDKKPTKAELKPCPFCGGEAKVEREGTSRVSMMYTCDDCGCTLETGETGNTHDMWNRRSYIQAQLEAVGEHNRDLIYDELGKAYVAGCQAVHENWQPDTNPDFKEAGYDYATSQTEAVLLSLHQSPPQAVTVPSGWRIVPEEPTQEMLDACAEYDLGQDIVWKKMLSAAPAQRG